MAELTIAVDSLREMVDRLSIVREPTLLDLQSIKETEVVLGDLDSLRQRSVTLAMSPATTRSQMQRADRAVVDAERVYSHAIRRDAVIVSRHGLGPSYVACWCLGYGGNQPRYLPIVTKLVYADEHVNEHNVIEEQEVLGSYCECPDGDDRRRSDNAIRRRYWNDRDARLIQRMFGEAKIPPEYRRHDWTTNPDTVAVARAQSWRRGLDDAPKDKPWLLIWGDPGRGKTAMAAGLAQDEITAGRPVLFRPMPDLLQEIKATYNPANPNDESELIALLKRVHFLVIDDIGAEVPSGWEGDRLYQILNHRHNHHMPTILTTNLGGDALSEHLGERLFGRIKRMATVIPMAGPDLRDIA